MRKFSIILFALLLSGRAVCDDGWFAFDNAAGQPSQRIEKGSLIYSFPVSEVDLRVQRVELDHDKEKQQFYLLKVVVPKRIDPKGSMILSIDGFIMKDWNFAGWPAKNQTILVSVFANQLEARWALARIGRFYKLADNATIDKTVADEAAQPDGGKPNN